MPEDAARPAMRRRRPAAQFPVGGRGPWVLRFRPHAVLTDELFAALAAANDVLRLERNARGDLEVMAPAGMDSSSRNNEIAYQLTRWSKEAGNGLGVVFDSSGGFTLPDAAIRNPDACWMTRERWEALTPEQRKTFSPVCPDFVVELRSPSDRLVHLRKKMREYLANGARLGWLIDPIRNRAEVYRPGRAPEVLDRPASLSGEDVLPGFVLELKGILGD